MRSFALPGGLAGPPGACSDAPNRIDVFAAGPGNTVWRWSWDGSSRTPPGPLPGHGSIPAEGVCAVASGPGRVEVFAAQAGTRTPVWWRGNNTSWSAGPALPQGASLPALPVAAVAASPNDIDVFAAGAGDTPWSVPGDYDGDGRTDFAFSRPSSGTWFVLDSSTGRERDQQWGQHGDIPV